MVTIFSTPKPFKGHEAITQRNALQSWTLLHPEVEILLFGDDEGAREMSEELRIKHIPKIRRSEYGAPFLNYIFEEAQKISKHDLLCYINADMILMSDFARAVGKILDWGKFCLAVGRRWNLDIDGPIDFRDPDWERRLKETAFRYGSQRFENTIDYFMFSRGVYRNMPPLYIARMWWDQWLIWKARREKTAVVDISHAIMAVHQNHSYAHDRDAGAKNRFDEEVKHNFDLIGGWQNLYTMANATHMLTPKGIRCNFLYWLPTLKGVASRALIKTWHFIKKLSPKDRKGLQDGN